MSVVFIFLFVTIMLNSSEVLAGSAEYKCTNKCTFCVTVDKKVICSEKFSEDSDDFEKSRLLKKYVTDGLINPDNKLKQGFSLDSFSKKYFNCELMIKKTEQIQDATQKMCIAKTARFEKKSPKRNTASTVKAKAKKSK